MVSNILAMEESQDGEEREDLAASFRQSRKEFRFMVVTWVVFAAWTLTYNGLFAKGSDEQPVEIVLGMPKWVVFGVAIPWAIALALTVWFALFYMKDTDLGEPADENGGGEA